jgi:hypothetical protein
MYGLGGTLLFLLSGQPPSGFPQRRLRLDTSSLKVPPFLTFSLAHPSFCTPSIDVHEARSRGPFTCTQIPHPTRYPLLQIVEHPNFPCGYCFSDPNLQENPQCNVLRCTTSVDAFKQMCNARPMAQKCCVARYRALGHHKARLAVLALWCIQLFTPRVRAAGKHDAGIVGRPP